MITLAQFVAQWNGRALDYDHAFGPQCVDVADQYLQDVWGVPVFYVTGAVDIFGHRPDLIEWIANDVGNASQYPQPGDIVVWHLDAKVGVGTLGHVDVFVSGNGLAFTGFDQNWPLNSYCHLQAHNYEGVKGWGRRRPAPPPPPPPPPPPKPAPAPTPAPPPAPAPHTLQLVFTMRNSGLLAPVIAPSTFDEAFALAEQTCKENPGSSSTLETTIGPEN